jgi:hypothetical protein
MRVVTLGIYGSGEVYLTAQQIFAVGSETMASSPIADKEIIER